METKNEILIHKTSAGRLACRRVTIQILKRATCKWQKIVPIHSTHTEREAPIHGSKHEDRARDSCMIRSTIFLATKIGVEQHFLFRLSLDPSTSEEIASNIANFGLG